MKAIKYRTMTEVNYGTEEQPDIVQTFNNCEIHCSDESFESNLKIVKREAYGEITVEDIESGTPEPSPKERIVALEKELELLKQDVRTLTVNDQNNDHTSES